MHINIWWLVAVSVFNLVLMGYCLSIYHDTEKKGQEILDKLIKIKRDDTDKRVDEHGKYLMNDMHWKAQILGHLRFVHIDTLTHLVMISIKHDELSHDRAAEILGLFYEEMRDLTRNWHSRNFEWSTEKDCRHREM